MSGPALALLVVAGIVAVADWVAVARDDRRAEYVAKPGTMVALVLAALVLDPVDGTQRSWFVAALLLSLLGDVFLMLPSDRFVPGLASFLLGHVAYILGLLQLERSTAGLLVGAGIVAVALPFLGTRIVRAVRAGPEPELLAPVGAYIAVITAMVLAAGASGEAIALAAAVSFYASDALIAWTRFVQPLAWGRVAVIVTYHLAQIGFVISLV